MPYRQKHDAECSSCHDVHITNDDGTFVDRFFLPDICPSCGEGMFGGPGAFKLPHWLHVVRKQKWIPAKRTKNPLTWLRSGRWEDVERMELEA